jgi:RNA polymerase sigma factor (TIGR02999 family)
MDNDPEEHAPGDVTQLLVSWRDGNAEALDELLVVVYEELRGLASHYLRNERHGHTLQPTALVHEAYVKLMGKTSAQVKDRSHFFAVAAQAMRRVLVDHARRHSAGKRFGAQDKVALEDSPEPAFQPDTDVLALHEALEMLQEVNPRQAKLVELRYFGGLTNNEAAEVLEVSVGTVERDWQVARLWLHRRLNS